MHDIIQKRIKSDIDRQPFFISNIYESHLHIFKNIQAIIFNVARLTERVKGKPKFMTEDEVGNVADMIGIHLSAIRKFDDTDQMNCYTYEYLIDKLILYRELSLENEYYEYVANIDKLLKYYCLIF